MKKFYVLLRSEPALSVVSPISSDIIGIFEDEKLAKRIFELEERNNQNEYIVELKEVSLSDDLFREKLKGREFYKLHIGMTKIFDGLKKFPPFDQYFDNSTGFIHCNEFYDNKEETFDVRYKEEKFDSYNISFDFTFVLDAKEKLVNVEDKNKQILRKIEKLFIEEKNSKEEVIKWVSSHKVELINYLLEK